MPRIELQTRIQAPVERVFDLARSIDAHVSSTIATRERAVAGRTSGLIGPGETVTWEARHFWVRQRLTVKITAFDRPRMFEDEMVHGAFATMSHRHRFVAQGPTTVMTDEFEFTAPLGFLGRIAERTFLSAYMRSFLETRNKILKQVAESDQWKLYLPENPAESVGDTRTGD